MPFTVGGVLGAFLVMFLLSRLLLWLFGSLGDSAAHILVTHAVALAVACIVDSFVLAGGGLPHVSATLGAYGLPTAVWAMFDLMRYWRRQAARA